MIGIEEQKRRDSILVRFVKKNEAIEGLTPGAEKLFLGEYLQTCFLPVDQEMTLFVGMGNDPLGRIQMKELAATAVKECRSKKVMALSMDISGLVQENGAEAVRDITEGALLGEYELPKFGEDRKEKQKCEIVLFGIPAELRAQAEALLAETTAVAEGVIFARDMVNMPGNLLRPAEFAKQIMEFVEETGVEAVCYDQKQLSGMGMDALLAVGDSSEFPPFLLVLRYQNDKDSSRKIGLVGKGVTCDTGGYCLKAAGSMLGIKGDMAGAAAVAGAVYALAKRQVKTNVTAVLPICENRISPGSLLPGDVISSYSGKTIEIGNTDAEGRLILADAVSYAVKDEKVTELLDIATLTGAVVGLLGFSIAGVLSDGDAWYDQFARAYDISGERYLKIPFYKEHEKMIESQLADVKNISSGGCGTITAGLFIRKFAQEKPWLHLDIAGTAWVDAPVFAFQSKGATGAAVTTLYQLCSQEG